MKKFTTYEEQLDILKTRNLIIKDEAFLLTKLKDIGYYNLINGYSDIFKGLDDKYRNQVSDKDILALYTFDKQLRSIVYKYAMLFESRFKSIISYVFSKYHGEDEKKYLLRNNFDKDPSKEVRIAETISKLNTIITDASNKHSGKYRKYIEHYVKDHNHVPLWVLIRAMTFGDVSMFYSNMTLNERTEIAAEFNLTATQLEIMVKILVGFRNVVAHDERVYCKRLLSDRLPSNLDVYNIMRIEKTTLNTPKCGRCDFLSLMIVFKYLLKSEEFAGFWFEFDAARTILINNIKSHFVAIINNQMGLKNRWKNLQHCTL